MEHCCMHCAKANLQNNGMFPVVECIKSKWSSWYTLITEPFQKCCDEFEPCEAGESELIEKLPDYAALTWRHCSSCQPDRKGNCEKCWSEWNRRAQPEQPEVAHGRWQRNTDDFTPAKRCSICGYNKPIVAGENISREPENYCPNCGAKMDAGECREGGNPNE